MAVPDAEGRAIFVSRSVGESGEGAGCSSLGAETELPTGETGRIFTGVKQVWQRQRRFRSLHQIASQEIPQSPRVITVMTN
jgi:hypothetical protein